MPAALAEAPSLPLQRQVLTILAPHDERLLHAKLSFDVAE